MEPAGNTTHRLGRYHLAEPVGGGPTGEVYRAKVHGVAGFEREFALKKFHPQLVADGASLGALRAAARLYAGLEHPRIARLSEHNLDGPVPFAAVEWVSGIDVARLVAATFGHGRPLPAGAATSLMSRAARAVGYAHGRGQRHLGLSPTNLICTPAGEIKVTDFGFLSARLGPRPAEDATLTRRLPYVAPEQISGASTSPATDVFTLGAIFYELLSGEVAFTGKSGREIAASVLASSPTTDSIPKPLARVLSRCFAQSPFERYPGGSALADAIDAAARGMLMRGDQRDVARVVLEAQERLAAMREKQVSGVLSFPMPAAPASPASPGSSAAIASQRSLGVPNLELDERVQDEAITDVLPVGTPALPPIMAAAGSTVPSLPPPVTPRASRGTGTDAAVPPLPIGAPPATPGGAPSPSRFGPAPSRLGPPPTPPPSPSPDAGAGGIAALLEDLPTDSDHATVPFTRAEDAAAASLAPPIPPSRPLETVDGALGPGAAPDTPPPTRPPSQIGDGLLASRPSSLGRRGLIALAMASVGALGFFGYLIIFGDSGSTNVAKGGGAGTGTAVATVDASPVTARAVDASAQTALVDASALASRPDAAAINRLDAGIAAPATLDAAPIATEDASTDDPVQLVVTSKPRRALVYLDGTKIGKTPVKVDIGADKHKLVVIRAGHKLHIAQISGGGEVNVELEPVTPSGGPAGIKVRCRKKNRYYAFIDGVETGQLCPTERIEVELGAHTVEVYDPVSDSRRRWDVEVVQTRRSHRVRVDF